MNPVIQFLSASDLAPAEKELICQLNQELSWSIDSTLSTFDKAYNHFALLRERQDILSYCCYQQIIDQAEILYILVLPSYRQKGLGGKFLQEILERMQEVGAQEVFLEVRASNLAGQGLYRKMGFEQIAIRPNYYHEPKEDARIMKLNLNAKEG